MYRFFISFILILLSGCIGKSDKIEDNRPNEENEIPIPATEESDDINEDEMSDCERESLSTNHNECPPTDQEIKESIAFAEGRLNLKGVKLIDYRNSIYEYLDQRFYFNHKFNFILRYPKDMLNGDEAFSCDGNYFYRKDSTIVIKAYGSYYDVISSDISLKEWFNTTSTYDGEIPFYKEYGAKYFVINGINKKGINFIRKGIYHQAYERETTLFLEIYFKRDYQKEALEIWNHIVSKFPDNPF